MASAMAVTSGALAIMPNARARSRRVSSDQRGGSGGLDDGAVVRIPAEPPDVRVDEEVVHVHDGGDEQDALLRVVAGERVEVRPQLEQRVAHRDVGAVE